MLHVYRSPRALSLLQWYYQRVEPLPAVANSIQRYVDYLLQKKHWAPYGLNSLALPTGFVGLAIADLIEPFVTFGPVAPGRELTMGPHPLWN